MPGSNLDWALRYAEERKWSIFPIHYLVSAGKCSCRKPNCNRIAKHPITREGVNNASNDLAMIRNWWREYPYANIGLATGRDGLIVIDIDTSNGKTGAQSLAALEAQYGALPDTLRVKTGGGGAHYYYVTIHDIKNSTDLIGKHIDVRGRGGYVILPPSDHYSGGHYEWGNDFSTPITEVPEWLVARAMTRAQVEIDEIDPEIVKEAKAKLKNKLTGPQLIKLLEFIPPDCDREIWWKVGAALKIELGETAGWNAWKEWSLRWQPADGRKGWNEDTSLAQWRSFEEKGITGGTIYQFALDAGFKGFDAEAADAPDIRDKWIYAVSVKRFVEIERSIELDKEQFDAVMAPLFIKGAPSQHTLKNENFKRVDGVTYAPEKELLVWEGGKQNLNYWRSPGIVAAAGDTALFERHVNYLFPSDKESNILLDYLSFQVQFPGEKINWAILMQGVQGNGKSYFGTMLKTILGESNVRSVTNEMLHETFTGWSVNKQFIIVEEMMASRRLDLMNKLKPMITEPWISVREMHKPAYELPNRINFLFLTNHPDPILIDSTDRRYCVLASKAGPHPEGPSYYARLFDWTRNNAPALLGYLKQRDLSGFLPKAHAPMTEGKKTLIEESLRAEDSFIKERVEGREFPFTSDIISINDLPEVLRPLGFHLTPKDIARSFLRLGYAAIQGGVWAMRNAAAYIEMDRDQLRQIMSVQRQGGPIATPGVTPEELRGAKPINVLKDGKPI